MHRRTLLGLTVVAMTVPVASACTSSPDPAPSPTPSPEDSGSSIDSQVRSTVIDQEDELLARYTATISAHPSLSSRLTPLANQHRSHREALDFASPDPSPTEGGASWTGTISPDPAVALTDLVAAERAAADARTLACEQSQSRELAQLLALIAASEASHAESLSRGDVA